MDVNPKKIAFWAELCFLSRRVTGPLIGWIQEKNLRWIKISNIGLNYFLD